MPGKLLWGDIMELEAPLEESENQKKERQKNDRRKSRHHYDSDEKSETRENGVGDDLDAPKSKKAKMKEKLNGDTEEGFSRLSDAFSKSHKSRRKGLPNGDIDEYEKKSMRASSLDSSHKSSDNKLQEILTREQKEGDFSNFPISEETIKLLKVNHIRNGIDILVGTPGRIKDHLQSGRLDLSKLRHVVLDEVDQMLDLGFAEQVEDIIHESYKTDSEDNPQTLLFSATCPQWVYKVAKKYMKSRYEQVDLVGKMTQKAATTVEHLAIQCHWSQRPAVIGDVLQVYSGSEGRAIIFCETKKNVTEMAMNPHIKQNAQCLHGDIAQSQREITLKGFREGSFKVLVATNVAARGLDIPEVDLVIQSSPPQGITFKRVGVPSTMDLVKSKSMDAIRSLASVSYAAVDFFRPSAQRLIEEKGAVDALAAALAHISGASSFEPRSLITSDKGFVTMTLESPEEIQDVGCARKELNRKLSSNAVSQITRMCLLKGNMWQVFAIHHVDLSLLRVSCFRRRCLGTGSDVTGWAQRLYYLFLSTRLRSSVGLVSVCRVMPGKLSDSGLESDTTMGKVKTLRKQNEKKGKKEKPKVSKTEESVEEKEETISPKAKKVKKKADPTEVDMSSPKSKKTKKEEEPLQGDIISPKTKSSKKKKEPSAKEIASPKTKKKGKKEKPKVSKTEESVEEKEETISPKAKKVKKKADPTEVDMSSPKSKKTKKEEEPLQGDIISPKTKSSKKKKEPSAKEIASPKTKKVIKSEEPPEEEIDAPKPKKLKKEAEVNGDIGEKSPKLKNGFAPSDPYSNSNEAASEESNSEAEQEISVEQKEGAFSNFPISEETIKLLKGRGVTFLFPIQAKTFHHVYSGKDLIAQARTGTGKTFSFAIPLIEKLQGEMQDKKRGRSPQVLVLTPTRELASQVSRDFSDITKKLSVACFYGGTPYGGQIERMRNGIDILVGTPGRIKDHLQNGKLDLTKLKHVVLDEVDQMLDMGFADQVEEILCVAYKKDSEDNPQTLLFSATCPHWVFNVAKKYMKPSYEQVDLIGKKTQKTAITVEHLAIKCHWTQRAAVIGDVIRVYSGHQGRTIIFCETKKEAQELSQNTSIKQDAQSLHGDIPQKQREITLKGFRNGNFGVLVATNVAARGLDIPEVDLVVQCSPPKGIKFKRIGVPSATEIIKASSKDAIRLLDSVPPTAISHFKQSAEKLIEEKGAVEALAAALAHISGATSVDQRSLINSNVGFVTMILRCSIEMPNISYAWKELKEQLGEDVDSKVKGMVFLKGKLNNQRWKDPGKDLEASGVNVKETETSGVSVKETETSGDSDQEVATEITDSKTKAKNGVLIKHLVNN
ncbi:Nucleolar RNA helicase 2 [Tupaia chinensis]|uniref:RNA helicase n=1 Tax=Tupaia chinensis TaxID=246437 RepID=L9KSH1_TUPCH|nr:Nucleolar RNA helicase 2 [Tupaia chinensis]